MNNTPSFPVKLLRCLYDIRYYSEVLKHKTSKAVKFAILLGLFFGTLTMIRPLVDMERSINMVIADMERSHASFSISEGVMTSSSQKPYMINKDNYAIVVDPGDDKADMQPESPMVIYFSKSKVSIRNELGNETAFSYKSLLSDTKEKVDLALVLSSMSFVSWLVLIPMGGLYGIVMVFMSASITMFFGRVVYAFSRKPISYRDSFVIAVHAQVLTATLFLLSSIFRVAMPLFYPLCLMMMGMYFLNLARLDNMDHS